ncbi:MAG: beta-ketoacyl synthase N-terminal-like domain-containing protein, partial [Gemmataceae bacterium]
MTPANQVWITGVGVVTTLGASYPAVADSLLAGRSGIDRVHAFDVAQHPSQIGARIEQVPCPAGWESSSFAQRNRVEQAALWCCAQALRDAGLWEQRGQRRIGLILGVGSEWLLEWEADSLRGGDLVHHPENEPPAHLRLVQHELGLGGPALLLSTACASGNHALTIARHWIRQGLVDTCLAGACDMNV